MNFTKEENFIVRMALLMNIQTREEQLKLLKSDPKADELQEMIEQYEENLRTAKMAFNKVLENGKD